MKSVKKIVALATGAVMVGATIMGATATADLADYPAPFVEGCTFNGNVVVGANAASEDVVGAIDVIGKLATSGTQSGSSGSTGSVAVAGDSWEVDTGADKLEITEQVSAVTSYISDGDLNALSDGTFTNNKGSFPYEQELRFGAMDVDTYEDDDDNVGAFLKIADGVNYINYTLTFTTSAESDVTTATTDNGELKDFKNKKISILGMEYTIVKADAASSTNQNSVELRLMGGAVNDIMEQGQTKTYTVDGKDYEVELTYVGTTDCKFKVNGETTELMVESDTDTVAGIELGVKDIMEEEAGEVQPDQVEFYLGADKIILQDTNIADTVTSTQLKVGDETMDEAAVIIRGSNSSDVVKLDEIKIVYTADDDLYFMDGDKITDKLEEPQAHINFDIQYEGLTEVSSNEIKVDPSNDNAYELKFKTYAGPVTLPIAWKNDTTGADDSMVVGAEGEKLVLDPEHFVVNKEEYFILTPSETIDKNTRSEVLQYKGADKESASSPKIKFRNLATGETIEKSWDATNHYATLKLGGNDYIVKYVNTTVATLGGRGINGTMGTGGLNPEAKDFPIAVSTALSSTYTNGTGVQVATADVVTEYGAHMKITDFRANQTYGNVSVNITEVESNMLDEQSRAAINWTFSGSGAASLDITDASFEGLTLRQTKEDSDVSVGWTNYGAKVTKTQESSAPDKFVVEWPAKQRNPQVFITSGEVKATQVGSGDGTMVCRVDVPAAKLDTEVADVTAQNLIVVGGPCINSAAASVMGVSGDFPACAEGFEEGKAKIKFMDAGSNVALVVAGYSAMDTRRATRVLKNYEDYSSELSGDEVEVVGTSLTDISVSVPTMVVETTE